MLARADQIALRVGEVADHEIGARIACRPEHPPAAGTLCLLQRLLDIGNSHIKDRMGLVAVAATDPGDAGAVAGLDPVDETIVAGIGNRFGNRTVGVERPAKNFAVEAPQLGGILA